MRVRITATSIWCSDDHEKLINTYPCLLNYGYEVEKEQNPVHEWIRNEAGLHIKQETDKVLISYTHYIHIDTIEQLVQLIGDVKDEAASVVMTEDSIEIYDDWRE